MYLQKFPNIDWVRRNASQNFASGKDYLGNDLPSTGWPNVILNVKSTHTERDNIKGPFSLFYNLQGKSLIGLDKRWYQVSNNFYCLSNNDQHFNLHVPPTGETTTFNIHFGRSLFEDVVQLLFHSPNWILDNGDNISIPNLEVLSKTNMMNEELKSKLLILHNYGKYGVKKYSMDKEYEMCASILELLLLNTDKSLKKIDLINAQKAATRKELFKRINIGLDYIHSNELINLNLKKISKNCGLSKFHFIRVFKEIYKQTPSEYISQLKVKKAQILLSNSHRDLSSIALELGFSELSAFTRFYKRRTGRPPSSDHVTKLAIQVK